MKRKSIVVYLLIAAMLLVSLDKIDNGTHENGRGT